MSSSEVDTKQAAYKLVHDPARLLSLLFSKYGDIEEDYFLLISNQLIFNKSTHLNILFKEKKLIEDKDEYMRRFYNKKETLKRIPKLNDYYKNYHIFFCKPTLTDFALGGVLKSHEDNKAEIFYKNNYNDSNLKDEDKSDKCESSSLSSLDNITYNKVIFDKRNKEIIENDLDSKNISITLTLNSLRLNKDKYDSSKNLISMEKSSEKENSFIESIKNIVYYHENKKKSINKKKQYNNNIMVKEILKNNNKEKDNKDNINKDNKKDNKDNITEKMNNLSNICKKINENIKSKKNANNGKVILEKSNNNNIYNNKDNKEKNTSKLLNKLNIHNSLYSLSKKPNTKGSKKNSTNKNNNNNTNNTNNNNNYIFQEGLNKNNIFLSPQASKNYFINITSRISEFNKYKPLNIKNSKRNKSYRINNNININLNKNHLIKQNQANANNNKNQTFYPYNNQFMEHNFKNKSITTKNKNQNNINFKNNSNHHIKPNPSQLNKYNQFLMINTNKNNIKNYKNNKTFDLNMLEPNPKNFRIFPKNKNFMYNLKKMTQSSNNSPMSIEYNALGSKFNLFKSGVSSPYHYNNNQNQNQKGANRHFNNFQTYNKISMNQTTNFNENKKFMISNSIENHMHLNSLSPKSISSNITINNDKKRSIGINKISFNKINNNYKNQNNKNKIKIPVRHNKNSISYSNSNYNINFNNLIFYGPNTPTSFIDDIKYNIINNSNNSNHNLNKINTNFYMMNFNNIYNNNSRNKIKFSTNNSNSQNKVKTHTNSQSKNMKKIENEKHCINLKKNGASLVEKKIPFTMNRQFIGRVKKHLGNTLIKEKNRIKINNINCNLKNNNSVKKKSNKSFNISDSEKNIENNANMNMDKIEKKKFSMINLRGISSN